MTSLHCQTVSTPIGDLRVATSATAVVAVSFSDVDDFEKNCDSWSRANPNAQAPSDDFAATVADGFARYFDGDVDALNELPTDPALPPASVRALQAVGRIPAGKTRAYSEIASDLNYGRLGARFVGGVNARNPIPLIIPCHRVVGKDGSLTGYAGSVERKAWLLEWERTNANGSH